MAYGSKLDFGRGGSTSLTAGAAPFVKQAGDIFGDMATRKQRREDQDRADARANLPYKKQEEERAKQATVMASVPKNLVAEKFGGQVGSAYDKLSVGLTQNQVEDIYAGKDVEGKEQQSQKLRQFADSLSAGSGRVEEGTFVEPTSDRELKTTAIYDAIARESSDDRILNPQEYAQRVHKKAMDDGLGIDTANKLSKGALAQSIAQPKIPATNKEQFKLEGKMIDDKFKTQEEQAKILFKQQNRGAKGGSKKLSKGDAGWKQLDKEYDQFDGKWLNVDMDSGELREFAKDMQKVYPDMDPKDFSNALYKSISSGFGGKGVNEDEIKAELQKSSEAGWKSDYTGAGIKGENEFNASMTAINNAKLAEQQKLHSRLGATNAPQYKSEDERAGDWYKQLVNNKGTSVAPTASQSRNVANAITAPVVANDNIVAPTNEAIITKQAEQDNEIAQQFRDEAESIQADIKKSGKPTTSAEARELNDKNKRLQEIMNAEAIRGRVTHGSNRAGFNLDSGSKNVLRSLGIDIPLSPDEIKRKGTVSPKSDYMAPPVR